MPYSINQLAKLAGISVRTLHYYDEIGLLRPGRVEKNGYRSYGEDDLLRLQQILFFRELDLPLTDVKKMLDSPAFDRVRALRDHRQLIALKIKRLNGLSATIDKTVRKLTSEINMDDKELYDAFDMKEVGQYAEEAKRRWGHTDAYKQSTARVKKMGKAGLARIAKESDELMKEIAARAGEAPDSEAVQKLIKRHYDNLRNFYEPTLEMYRGLAEMYVADPRFTAYYEKYRHGLAEFMRQAMIAFCDAQAKDGK